VAAAQSNTCAPGAPGPELCDGKDNDCDGSTADDGTGESWYNQPTSCGVGQCAASGALICVAGAQSNTCTPGIPSAEVCDDGKDNDCDGLTDGADPNCGADSDGDGWSDDVDNCPTTYNPTQTDADSDGVGDACDNCPAVGNPGQQDCNNNGVGDACDAINPGAADSDCDGVDDNCNGTADDQYVPTPTSCGVGQCAASGALICVAGAQSNTCTPGAPGSELCDGKDNDCDGSTADDGTGESWYNQPTSCGVGQCAASGALICVAGAQSNTCTPGIPITEVCDDGLDNDCDGLTDGDDPNCGAPPEELTIDIKPGSYPNPIDLKSKGVIPVAILTSATFDATTVDPSSVCFGDAEDPSQRDCTEAHGRGHIQDVDGDGDLDLVLHYETGQTGIDLGDTQACLTGDTFDGITLPQGCDSIKVVPAKGAGGMHGGMLALGAPLGLLGIRLGRNALEKTRRRL
jgi:hypothetical protein